MEAGVGVRVEIVSEVRYNAGYPERPLVVAYYTVDTPYEGEAEVLKLSLESVGYDYRVSGVPNLGSWQRNTQYKARFLRFMLEAHPGRPLLYLDVDAVVIHPPKLLDGLQADLAAVHFANRRGRPGTELLSGTLWLGNTPACWEVVQEWIRLNEQYPVTLPDGREAWDQRTLALAIQRVPDVHFAELPQEYTWIAELTQRYNPGLQPVILHTRGAKRFKNLINGKKGFAV